MNETTKKILTTLLILVMIALLIPLNMFAIGKNEENKMEGSVEGSAGDGNTTESAIKTQSLESSESAKSSAEEDADKIYYGYADRSKLNYSRVALKQSNFVLGYDLFTTTINYGEQYFFPLYVYDDNKPVSVYCFNSEFMWPGEEGQTSISSQFKKIKDVSAEDMKKYATSQDENLKDDILRTVYNGYPYNASEVQERHYLSEMQFRAVTQAALWRFTDNMPLQESIDGLIYNQLMDRYGNVVIIQNFDWTDDMTNAYNDLINNVNLSNYDNSFGLDLYIAQDKGNASEKGVQNLLSTVVRQQETEKTYNVGFKKIKEDNTGLEGARFELYKVENHSDVYIDAWNTPADGRVITARNLKEGTYKVKEIRVPVGYEQIRDFTFDLSNAGAISNIKHIDGKNVSLVSVDGLTVVIKNKAIINPIIPNAPTDISVEIKAKKLLDGKAPGENNIFRFLLKDADGNIISETTNDADGNIVFPDKVTELGTYTVEEVNDKDKHPGVLFDPENTRTVTVAVAKGQYAGLGSSTKYTGGGQYQINGTPNNQDQQLYVTLDGNKNIFGYCMYAGKGNPKDAGQYTYIVNPTTEEIRDLFINGEPSLYDDEDYRDTSRIDANALRKVMYYLEINRGKNFDSIGLYTGTKAALDKYKHVDINNKSYFVTNSLIWYATGDTAFDNLPVGGGYQPDPNDYPEQAADFYGYMYRSILKLDLKVPDEYKLVMFKPVTYVKGNDVNDFQPVITGGKIEESDIKIIGENPTFSNTKEKPKETRKEVLISKINLDGEDVVGAKIEIYKGSIAKGTPIETWTTVKNEDHKVLLEPGQYVFKETYAPEGYIAVTDIVFSVYENGNVVVDNVNGNIVLSTNNELVVTDKYKLNSLGLLKVDGENNPISDVRFTLNELYEDGLVRQSHIGITDGNGEISFSNLKAGTYVLYENEEKPGYTTPDKLKLDKGTGYKFKLTIEGRVEPISTIEGVTPFENGFGIIVVNKKETKNISISKVNLGGKEISGAVIQIYKGNIVSGTPIEEWTSIANKTHVIKLEAGEYIFHEVSAPTGYEKVTDIVFNVDVDGKVTVENGENREDVNVEKGELIVTDKYVPVKVQFGAIKTLKVPEGSTRKLGDREFTFELVEGEKVIQEKQNDKEGNIVFDEILYSEPGTYKYAIKEKIENKDSITYDEASYDITVSVTAGTEGLVAKQAITKKGVKVSEGNIKFNNTYNIEPTEVKLEAFKKLIVPVGSDRVLQNDEFTFELVRDNKVIRTVGNNENGKVEFDALKFDKAGVYEYVIREKAGKVPGITYTDKNINVRVEVKENSDGTLTAKTTYDGKIEYQTFENTYIPTATTVELSATKTLEGKKLEADMFSFTLSSDSKVLQEKKNNEKGAVKFDALEFDKVGVYTYTISEVQNNINGITCDASTYIVTIIVEDKNGALNATTVIKKGEEEKTKITFVNKYKVGEIGVVFRANKILKVPMESKRVLQPQEFEFLLFDNTGEIQKKSNDVNGNIVFDEIKFNSAGTYEYTIREVNSNNSEIKYDSKEVKVKVVVTDNQDGTLNAKITYDNKDEIPTFVNEREATSYQVNKIWIDSNNGRFRPDSIKVNLMKKVGDSEPVIAQTVEISQNEAGEWKHVFTDLPIYEYGKKIEYSAVEEPVANYVATYDNTAGVTNITNRFTGKTIEFSKVSDLNSKEVAGATIVIKSISDRNFQDITWISDGVNTLKVTLPLGTYSFEETLAPKNHVGLKTRVKFEVKELPNKMPKIEIIEIDAADTNSIKIDNTKITIENKVAYKTVKFSKVENFGGGEIPGAKIEVYSVKGNDEKLIKSWTSSTKTYEFKLLPGEYYFIEKVAPTNYIGIGSETKVRFKVQESESDVAKITVISAESNITDNVRVEGNKIELKNRLNITDVVFSKVGELGGAEVPGAAIVLNKIDENGNKTEVESWISTDKVHEVRLAPGRYEFIETVAPNGYIGLGKDTIIEFEVKESTTKVITVNIITNSKNVKAIGNKIVIINNQIPKPEESKPEKPVEPEKPNEPKPETPVEPEKPNEPKPEKPVEPEKPNEPTPEVPIEPYEPEIPETPYEVITEEPTPGMPYEEIPIVPIIPAPLEMAEEIYEEEYDDMEVPGGELPETGGITPIVIYVVGGLLVVLGIIVALVKRKPE